MSERLIHFPSVFRRIFILAVIVIPFFTVAQKSEPCIENMSSGQRDKIENPDEGTMIFNTTTGCLNYYQGKRWRIFCESNNQQGENIQFDQNTGKLKYLINGQWYTFNMTDEPDDMIYGGTDEYMDEKPDQATVADLPFDCRRKPTRPYAGRDLVSFDNVELRANTPAHGNGFWQIMRGEGGHFIDSTVPNTRFKGIQGTTYHLRWTIATSCDTLFDEALVRIRPPCDPEPSQSFAGSDQFNVMEARLNANQPRVGNGSWTVLSGLGGRIKEPGNPKSVFTGRAGETYVLRWIIRNECGLTMDDIIISFKPPCKPDPSQAYAGDDQIEVDDCTLKAEKPEFGRGQWTIVSGENGRVHDPDTNITYLYGEPGETYVLKWTVSTKCGKTTDELKVKFSNFCPKEFRDSRDNQLYHGIRIAGVCWMKENLKFMPGPSATFCYDEYAINCNEFGGLYSWDVAMNGESKEGSRGICPKGWHVATDEEWQHLIDSSGYNGIELQVKGKSGFNIPMGGARYSNGKYFNRNEYAYYWSSTERDQDIAWNRYFPAKNPNSDRFPADKKHSFSLRCVKDEK